MNRGRVAQAILIAANRDDLECTSHRQRMGP